MLNAYILIKRNLIKRSRDLIGNWDFYCKSITRSVTLA